MTRIVAIHGFLGNARDWQPLKAAIQKLHPEIDFQTVELFSRTPDLKGENIDKWAKKFNQIQKNKHVERNIIMGYSLGGRLALSAAIDKPGLWDEVVLLSTHPGLQSHDEINRRRSSDLDWAEKFKNMPWNDVVKLWNAQPVFIDSSEPERKEGDYDKQALALALVKWSLSTQTFLKEKIVDLKPKLRWYVGEKDLKYLNMFGELKNLGFVDKLQVVPLAGHRLIFDKPEELARQLVNDLKL